MTTQNILNLIGLAVSMSGAFLMYHFTPKVNSGTFLYTRAEEEKIRRRDQHKNNMLRLGMFLLFIGFIFQITAVVIG